MNKVIFGLSKKTILIITNFVPFKAKCNLEIDAKKKSAADFIGNCAVGNR